VINGKKKKKLFAGQKKVGGGGGNQEMSWSLACKGLERDVLSVLGFAIPS
jgi:hypothetical protein